MDRRLLPAAALLAALLAGCAGGPRMLPSVQSAPGGAAAPALSLEAEQRRLAELFRDTPVVIDMTREGSLRVQVPLKFSFDKGRVAVKAPLAKVLDHVAPSAAAPGMKTVVLAPSDNGHRPMLANDRAASARDYLVSKGVPVTHFADVGRAPGDNIEIVIGRM